LRHELRNRPEKIQSDGQDAPINRVSYHFHPQLVESGFAVSCNSLRDLGGQSLNCLACILILLCAGCAGKQATPISKFQVPSSPETPADKMDMNWFGQLATLLVQYEPLIRHLSDEHVNVKAFTTNQWRQLVGDYNRLALGMPKAQALPSAGESQAQGSAVAAPKGEAVTLAWTASPDVDVVGYRIFYGPRSANYTNSVAVGNVSTAAITNLTPPLFFAATARDATGLESPFSNEASWSGWETVVRIYAQTNASLAGNFTDAFLVQVQTNPPSNFYRLRIEQTRRALP
jgi:hypothetical protein